MGTTQLIGSYAATENDVTIRFARNKRLKQALDCDNR